MDGRQVTNRAVALLAMLSIACGCVATSRSALARPSVREVVRPTETPGSAMPIPATIGVTPAATLGATTPYGPTVLRAPLLGFWIVSELPWKQRHTDPGALTASMGPRVPSNAVHRKTLEARRGDGGGLIATCRRPADYWETCRVVRASSLDELVAAFDTRLTGERRDIVLDGEPGVMLAYHAAERPAMGDQTLVYILSMHAGRPYAIRLWSSIGLGIAGADDVLAGFRFRPALRPHGTARRPSD